MTDMTGVAEETFQVLLRFDYTVELFDEDGMYVAEPSEARRMFAASPYLLVSLIEANDDSAIKLMFGKSTHVNDINGLMQALRTTATKYNMTFEPQQYGKEIDPKDYRNLMLVAESQRIREMKLCEELYGTSRSSYLQLKNARLIVRHTGPIAVNSATGRAHKIGDIFVENAAGERFHCPSPSLTAARALVQHVDAGGSFTDAKAKLIFETATQDLPLTRPFLAENNTEIKDFLEWTQRFTPFRALTEWNDPDDPYERQDDDAQEQAIDQFRVQDFLDSSEFDDAMAGRSGDAPDPDEREIDKGDVMGALKVYLHRHIENASPQFQDGYNGDTSDMADMFYDQVAEAMQQRGYTIIGGDTALLDDADQGAITREDVLLPAHNQGVSLSHEVLKSTVHDDPVHPDEEHMPGPAYTARLKTLAGLGRQTY